MEEDLILKLRNFSKLSFQSKVNILKKGRPIPDLKNLLQTTGRKRQITPFIRSGTRERNGCVDVL